MTLILGLVTCGRELGAPSSPTPIASGSASETVSTSPEPSLSPGLQPGEMPTSIAADLAPSEIPPEDLVPAGADVTGEWFAFTDSGVMVMIAWVEPGSDFSRLPHGYAVWRRHSDGPHWRADLVERRDPEDGIQGIQITTGDLTGDGSDDALVFEGIGGSGACGHWSVIDLARLEETYRRDLLCDARIEPGPPESPGLILTQSVYRSGDAHCCPSATRTTTSRWTGTAWRVTDRSLVEH